MSRHINVVGVLVLCGAAAIAAYGQSMAPSPQVTKSDIIEGMERKNIVVHPWQVSTLSTIPTHMEHPVLEAMKIEILTGDSSRVLMRCADRSSCIPFYVVVRGLTPAELIPEKLPGRAGSPSPKLASAPVMVKSGSKATLEIVAPEMVITIPVVCLQSGRQGEQIRVSSTDQHSIYMGEIISPGLIRGRM